MTSILTRRPHRTGNGLPSIFSGEPFGSLRQEFDQMLSNWFSNVDNQAGLPSFSPSLDMTETDAAYEVKVDLPGLQASDLNVQVSDNILTISGERKYEKKDEKKDDKTGKETPHYIERYHGTFSRSVVLPAPVQQDHIDAEYKDGVLSVTLPKAEVKTPCKITVK